MCHHDFFVDGVAPASISACWAGARRLPAPIGQRNLCSGPRHRRSFLAGLPEAARRPGREPGLVPYLQAVLKLAVWVRAAFFVADAEDGRVSACERERLERTCARLWQPLERVLRNYRRWVPSAAVHAS